MTEAQLAQEYLDRYERILKPLAVLLADKIKDDLDGTPRIDRVTARAKAPDRFMDKAKKLSGVRDKYEQPLEEIQDQLGVRIITFYLEDVEAIDQVIRRYYRYIEAKNIIPESENEFGYVGKHFVVMMPDDLPVKTENQARMPKFFELQIKTLFQHAWSEASHDLAYKPVRPLASIQKRQLAFTAAQAWGADQMFSSLSQELLSSPATPG